MKRKRSDNAPKAKKKKSRKVSTMTSFERTPTMESSRSSKLVEGPMPAPTSWIFGPSRSSKIAQPMSPASPIISSGIT